MTIRAKSSSKSLIFLPIPLALLLIFSLPHLSTRFETVTTTPKFRHGAISNLLHAQNLSHGAFHNGDTKLYLADLVARYHRSKGAVIIGLAWGAEARLLKDYDVHAIEPMPHFVESFQRNRPAHVTLYPLAAAKEQGIMKVTYQNTTIMVNKTRADAVLPRDIAPVVVSADTQGSEFDALQGLGEIIERTGSVWVELSCGENTEDMLRWLDKRFVLFDFVPWGRKRGAKEAFEENSFAIGERPDGIEEWSRWICKRRAEFKWLQTDVVGVKREIVEKCWDGLQNLGRECCREGCTLREIIAQK